MKEQYNLKKGCKMKGLIIRDFIINKKNIVITIMMLVLVNIMLTKENITNFEKYHIEFNIYIGFVFLIVYSLFDYALSVKKSAKWFFYLEATSITQETIRKERYIIEICILIFACIECFALIVIWSIKNNENINFEMFYGIIIVSIFVMLYSSMRRICCYFVKENISDLLILMFFITVITIIALDYNKYKSFFESYSLIILFCSGLIYYVSFILVNWLYCKKEKGYI